MSKLIYSFIYSLITHVIFLFFLMPSESYMGNIENIKQCITRDITLITLLMLMLSTFTTLFSLRKIDT